MATYPYLTNGPRNGYTMSAREMIRRLFPTQDYGTRVPADVQSGPDWTDIDGVQCAYLTTEEARTFWTNHSGKTSGMYMRALARCPVCDRITAASRINQHARVHNRKGA